MNTYFAWMDDRIIEEVERAMRDEPIKIIDINPTRDPIKIYMNDRTQGALKRLLKSKFLR